MADINLNLDNVGILEFNNWLNEVIYNDKIRIDELLIALCKRLVDSKVTHNTQLMAIKNKISYCLYDSTHPNYTNVREVSPNLEYSETDSELLTTRLDDDKIEILCQVVYKSKPVFIIRSHLEDKIEYKDILHSVADRINLAFRFKEERRFDRIQKNLIEEFFDKGLQTQEAWRIIAKYSSQFLPDFLPFFIHSPTPLSQILTYKEGDVHLIMRASQVSEPATSEHNERISIPLKIDETICGILIENRLDYLLCNPNLDYPDRYQAYLFHKQLAKSELVIPIKNDNKTIAIINIEHPHEKVFSDYCIETIHRAAKALAPIVKAVLDREERQKKKAISLLYVMTEVLGRMASVYRHKIGQLLLKSRTVIEDIGENYSNDLDLQNEIGYLREFINEFDKKSKEFLTEVPNYIKYQRIGISFVIKKAVNELDAIALERNQEITIKPLYPSEEIYVYASPMLKEHIYNLLNNSVLAIQQRIAEKKQNSGTINVLITYQEVTDTMKKRTSPSRVYIEITDNGGGVPVEFYPHIHNFGYTTRREKGGTGYGLPSAREYVLSVHGGDFKTENNPDTGFTVKFFLQEFDSSFHLTAN